MPMDKHVCVQENAIRRDGYQPFKSTIESRLNALAHRRESASETNSTLWRLRRGKRLH